MVRVIFLFCFVVLGVSNAFSNKAVVWQIFADYKTEEVLAINGGLSMNMGTDNTLIYYSTNDGKYIPMTKTPVKAINEYTLQLLVFFPDKPQNKFQMEVLLAGAGHIQWKNPQGEVQEFNYVGNDTSTVPTVQYGKYGKLFYDFLKSSKEDHVTIYSDTNTKESLALFKIDNNRHILYKASKSKKYVELDIISFNPANASILVSIPNDTTNKYSIKYIDCSSLMSMLLWIVNPNKAKRIQVFNFDEISFTYWQKGKSPAGVYLELLGK